LLGVSVAGANADSRLVTPSELRTSLPGLALPPSSSAPAGRRGPEEIYELAMLHAVQVIAASDPARAPGSR
jgi:hypothetical protein